MARRRQIPKYGTVVHNGVIYYRTRIRDADGKRVALYGKTIGTFQRRQNGRRRPARHQPAARQARRHRARYRTFPEITSRIL